MATIVILEHLMQRSLGMPYMMYAFAERWRHRGHKVLVHYGTENPPHGDIAILNVDLTVIPGAYRSLLTHYPRVINGAALDISKRRFSQDLLVRDSDYSGPVIVKTDANFGGRVDQDIRLLAEAAGMPSDIPIGPKMETYPIFRSPRDLPEATWNTPGLIVEKFLPEQDERGYYSRHWFFFGHRDRSHRCRANVPIIKSHDVLEREPTPVPDEIRRWREKLGFDFGKFDYVRHGERYVLLDINRTPTLPAQRGAEANARLDFLAEGLDDYFR